MYRTRERESAEYVILLWGVFVWLVDWLIWRWQRFRYLRPVDLCTPARNADTRTMKEALKQWFSTERKKENDDGFEIDHSQRTKSTL